MLYVFRGAPRGRQYYITIRVHNGRRRVGCAELCLEVPLSRQLAWRLRLALFRRPSRWAFAVWWCLAWGVILGGGCARAPIRAKTRSITASCRTLCPIMFCYFRTEAAFCHQAHCPGHSRAIVRITVPGATRTLSVASSKLADTRRKSAGTPHEIAHSFFFLSFSE